ncbi:hypothetical protein VTJ83DRAFT_6803 [Remersonia thermophila]|uniref:Stc1 domain-containing protein n=1 Tax=Remersonia thermophila TaxID=72144 RepID=A0ABR4D5Q5_9PEZI
MANGNIRCVNGEWKPRSAFSARQLAKYSKEARAGRATQKNSGIRCTEHSGPPIRHLECQGPCGRVRLETFFSRSTKRNGTLWCVDCVDGNIRAETDEVFDAPGEQLASGSYQPGMTSYNVLGDDDDDDGAGFIVVGNASNATAAPSDADNADEASAANANLPTQANSNIQVSFAFVPPPAQALSNLISTPPAAPSSEAVRNENPRELCTKYLDYLDFLERVDALFLDVAKIRPPAWIVPDLTVPWQDELAYVQKKQPKRVAKVEKAWPKPESRRMLAPRLPDYLRADIKTFQDDEWL